MCLRFLCSHASNSMMHDGHITSVLNLEASWKRTGEERCSLAPLILNPGAVWRWAVGHAPRPFYMRRNSPLNKTLSGLCGREESCVAVGNLIAIARPSSPYVACSVYLLRYHGYYIVVFVNSETENMIVVDILAEGDCCLLRWICVQWRDGLWMNIWKYLCLKIIFYYIMLYYIILYYV